MAAIEYPIHFIRSDGLVWTAETPADAVGLTCDTHHRRVVRSRDVNGDVLWEQVVEATWIARDSFGAIVDHADLPPKAYPKAGWWNRRQLTAQAAAERGLPIPGTGHARGGRAKRRQSAYVGERRDFCAFAQELAEEGLQDRMIMRLRHVGPAPYDEGTWRITERSWKNQRRTKWKQR